MKTNRFFAVAALLAGTSLSAHAAPVTFFGVDVNPGVPNLTSQPNSDAARNSFFSNLTGVGTETFNSFSAGQTPPFGINFGAAGTATISGSGVIATGVSSSNQYGLFDGVQASPYLNTTTGQFTIGFSSPIAAFGFYGIDLESQVTLNLTALGGAMSSIVLPAQVSGSLASGSIIYFGFYDLATTYTSISISNPTGGGDIYAFDNFSIGSAEQVTPVDVPEPLTMSLFGAGLVGAAALRRRKKAQKA